VLQVDIDLDLQGLESERRVADRDSTASCRERDTVLHVLKAALAAQAAAQVQQNPSKRSAVLLLTI